MAVIYMKHQQHGAKVAISEQEAQQDEQSGWTRFNPDDTDDAPSGNQLETGRRRRRAASDTEEEK